MHQAAQSSALPRTVQCKQAWLIRPPRSDHVHMDCSARLRPRCKIRPGMLRTAASQAQSSDPQHTRLNKLPSLIHLGQNDLMRTVHSAFRWQSSALDHKPCMCLNRLKACAFPLDT